MVDIDSIVTEVAKTTLTKDGGFFPGFSIRVQAEVLNRLASIQGTRTLEQVIGTEKSFNRWKALSIKGVNSNAK